MCLIKLKLAEALCCPRELEITVERFADIPGCLEANNDGCCEILFMRIPGGFRVKPYIAVFINSQILLDDDIALSSGDVVEFSLAMAGG